MALDDEDTSVELPFYGDALLLLLDEVEISDTAVVAILALFLCSSPPTVAFVIGKGNATKDIDRNITRISVAVAPLAKIIVPFGILIR